MKFTYTLGTIVLGSILLTGGCSQLEKLDEKLDKKNAELTKKLGGTPVDDEDTPSKTDNQELYARVQDYTGEGFYLPNSGTLTDKLAEKHKKEITKAVKEYFNRSYHTEITVHNLVGARDGISVFVESVGEPHFYTLAIVPVNLSNKEILLDRIQSLEGDVESSIETGLYAMLYKNELQQLDKYLENIQIRFPVTGMRIEAIQKTAANGFAKSEYYISNFDKTLDELGRKYVQDPANTINRIKAGNKPALDPKEINITIQLFMKDSNAEPDQSIFDQIVSEIKGKREFPPGIYNVILNDNKIIKRTGTGQKDNSLETTDGTIILN
ncbi:DUF1672 family protein [Bacillus sp. FJAT-42376]|uniref:DUF1672 family protein n=1 Tax=Bacillus sp. FJAT-42376 TaxID=2014076 RepID=UPI000F4FCB25|nr:DUF1672 family protein [Bacillus sp. FJAT-42376]AZB41029.1 DUF1672 family protein [Bacillus sp. FJAT-42376]